MAAHFDQARITVSLRGADSLTVAFEADTEDLMNTINTFPYYMDKTEDAYRQYENRLEAYLQQRLTVKIDGRRIFLKTVSWKRNGKGRNDRLDSVSIKDPYHVMTLGARLSTPAANRKRLEVQSEVWVEREDAKNPMMEYSILQDGTLLRQYWVYKSKVVTFPLLPDSLRAARKTAPPSRQTPRSNSHEGHDD